VIVARSSLSRLCSAMKQVCNRKFDSFERASRELSIRHRQLQALVSRIKTFQRHFASWTKEKHDIEREKLSLHLRVVSLERGLDSKSSQIDKQTQKLKDLMRTITLQDERLQNKQRFIEEKATELALSEQNLRKESDKNDKLYRLVRDESHSIKCLQREVEERSRQQEIREKELAINEQRLLDMERNLNEDHNQAKVGQQRIKDLSDQLQTRHEEVIRQSQQLEERQKQCNEYAARLRSWEEQLEHVTSLLQQGGSGNFSRHQHQHYDDDADSLRGIEDKSER
jgi:DNA repair exonuclease SbcCD ATPase subunit